MWWNEVTIHTIQEWIAEVKATRSDDPTQAVAYLNRSGQIAN